MAMVANTWSALRSPRRAALRGTLHRFVRHQRRGVKAITITVERMPVDRVPARVSATLPLPAASDNRVPQFARDNAVQPKPVLNQLA